MSLKVITFAVVFVLLTPCVISAAKCRHPRDCNPTTISDTDICDFHKVDNDLYRGGRPTCSGLSKLEALGIQTFINLEEAQKRQSAAVRTARERQGFASFHFTSPSRRSC